MKEFVVLDNRNKIIDRSTVIDNLTQDKLPDTKVIEFEGAFFIGDKIENGNLIPVNTPESERGRKNNTKQNETIRKASLRIKLKSGQALSDEEIDILLDR
jgi:hypothetical protein